MAPKHKIAPLVAIGIPTWGKVSVNWARSYRHLAGPLGANTVELVPVVGKPIAQARNELMAGAINENADFLFMLGDDVLVQPDTIVKMLQRFWDEPSRTLITGIYWAKHWPTQPYIWRGQQRGPYLDWKYGEFFELDYAGCDCLMIRLTDEVKALGPEWFSTDWKWDHGDGASLMATEDFFFYTKMRKAGIKLWCDSTLQCVHEDRNTGIQYALTEDMPQYTGRPAAPLPSAETDAAPLVKIADIGCGFTSPFFGHAGQVQLDRFDGLEATGPTYRCDLRTLPVPDQSYDLVHSKHVLEHFGRAEVMKVMREWTRILRVGGEFRLSVPNILYAIERIVLMDEGLVPVDLYPWWQLYGEQKDEYDIHKNGWTPNRVRLLLESAGIFEDISIVVGKARPGDGDNTNVFATAKKVKHIEPHALLPDWDAIGEAENIAIAGVMKEKAAETVVEKPVKVKRSRNGVHPEAVPV